MNTKKIALCALLVTVICCSRLFAQEKPMHATRESCNTFVRDFYMWYLPKARDTDVDSIDLALKERRSTFSSQIVKGVETIEAEARRNREAGLDFDWILNTQDPGDPGDPNYVFDNSNVQSNVCHVNAYRQLPNGKREKVVMPELEFKLGRWIFVNFHYPNSTPPSGDLLSLLRTYLVSNHQKAPKATLFNGAGLPAVPVPDGSVAGENGECEIRRAEARRPRYADAV